MEEILYKAIGLYSAVLREAGESGWIYGFPVHRTSLYGKKMDEWFIVKSEDALAEFQDIEEVYQETICRYIGVFDKNKKKIFENDIIKTKYGRLCVVCAFKSNCFVGFTLKAIETERNMNIKPPSQYDLWDSDNLEVVGNVFDKKYAD